MRCIALGEREEERERGGGSEGARERGSEGGRGEGREGRGEGRGGEGGGEGRGGGGGGRGEGRGRERGREGGGGGREGGGRGREGGRGAKGIDKVRLITVSESRGPWVATEQVLTKTAQATVFCLTDGDRWRDETDGICRRRRLLALTSEQMGGRPDSRPAYTQDSGACPPRRSRRLYLVDLTARAVSLSQHNGVADVCSPKPPERPK